MFRFTIRDVLWLMVVVALALGWITDRRRFGNSPAQLATLVDILAHQGIQVEFDQGHVGNAKFEFYESRIRVQGRQGSGFGLYDLEIGRPIPKTGNATDPN